MRGCYYEFSRFRFDQEKVYGCSRPWSCGAAAGGYAGSGAGGAGGRENDSGKGSRQRLRKSQMQGLPDVHDILFKLPCIKQPDLLAGFST